MLLRTCAVVALIFGVLTIFSGARGLFGGAQQQAALGAYVGFVLWFNFLAGFAYVIGGLGLWRRHAWAFHLSWAIAGATALVFALFGLHMASGGDYELRTVAAMTLRLAIWVGIAWIARHLRQPRHTAAQTE